MGKISPVSAKYVIHTEIKIDGVVDKPDVIGAIFGQTEGLLGSDLELRELQRSGRIGRIDVKLDVRSGKTDGLISIPSSLDKTETAIISAALETIQRIGPCNASVKIDKVEDIRISKRTFVIERAKEILRTLNDTVLPDSQEITDEVSQSVRAMLITEYGKDRLPAGPGIDEAEEIFVVEGRADVLNLLKNGIKNVVGMNGTSVPSTIITLSKQKVITAFVDGDRGGDLIIKELIDVAEIDYVVKAPDGKEVEELTKKEIHKTIRGKVAIEQVKLDMEGRNDDRRSLKPNLQNIRRVEMRKPSLTESQRADFKKMLDDLVGTRGAYLLDTNLNILGKVPITELIPSINSVSSVFAIILDGKVDQDILQIAERANIKYLIGTNSTLNHTGSRIEILTHHDLA